MSSPDETIGICFAIVLVFGTGFAAGAGYAQKSNQQDLVERGIGEWVVDERGNVEFKFKETKQ